MLSLYFTYIDDNWSMMQCLRNNICNWGLRYDEKLPIPKQCTSTLPNLISLKTVFSALELISVLVCSRKYSCKLRLTSLEKRAFPPLVNTFSGFTSFSMCFLFLLLTTIHCGYYCCPSSIDKTVLLSI
jgi:hypothetical protein